MHYPKKILLILIILSILLNLFLFKSNYERTKKEEVFLRDKVTQYFYLINTYNYYLTEYITEINPEYSKVLVDYSENIHRISLEISYFTVNRNQVYANSFINLAVHIKSLSESFIKIDYSMVDNTELMELSSILSDIYSNYRNTLTLIQSSKGTKTIAYIQKELSEVIDLTMEDLLEQ